MELLYFLPFTFGFFRFFFLKNLSNNLLWFLFDFPITTPAENQKKMKKRMKLHLFSQHALLDEYCIAWPILKYILMKKKGRKIVGHPVQYFMVHLFSFYCIFNLHYSLITKSDQNISVLMFKLFSFSLLCWTFSNTSLTSLQIVMPNTIHQQLPILLMYTYKDLFWTLLLFFRFALSSLLKMKLSLF